MEGLNKTLRREKAMTREEARQIRRIGRKMEKAIDDLMSVDVKTWMDIVNNYIIPNEVVTWKEVLRLAEILKTVKED